MHVRSTVGSLLGLLALLVTPWSLPLQVASTQAQSSSLFAFPVIIPDLSTDIFSPLAITMPMACSILRSPMLVVERRSV
jgi:hypothetical protein